MTNAELAQELADQTRVLRAAGDNLYRLCAYRRAALAVAGLPRPAGELSAEELAEVTGVGKKLAGVIRALAAA